MGNFRIFHRVKKQWWEGEAGSYLEALQLAGWFIGDCWVRMETRGRYSNGWRDITPREVAKPKPKQLSLF